MRSPSAIYPFSSQLLPIVNRFNELQSAYSLEAVLAPMGLGLIGRDAGYSCNKKETKIIISDEKEINSPHWETLHVFESTAGIKLETSHLLKIMKSNEEHC